MQFAVSADLLRTVRGQKGIKRAEAQELQRALAVQARYQVKLSEIQVLDGATLPESGANTDLFLKALDEMGSK